MDDITKAPESAVGTSEDAGTDEATPMVSRKEYDALKAAFSAYRVTTVQVATKYGNRMGGCSVVDQAIAEIDPTMKRSSFAASATVTITLAVEITEQQREIGSGELWDAMGSLFYEVSNRRGDVDRVGPSYGKATIVTPFALTDRSTGTELPEYVSPADWAAQQEASRAVELAEHMARIAGRRAANRAAGDYGTCDDCDTNLTHHRECPNTACGEYVARDADGNRVH